MTNKERRELAQAIIRKLQTDKDIEDAPEVLEQKPKSYSQKAKEVDDFIKNELSQNEIEIFVSSASQREKAKAVDNIFKDFQRQNADTAKNKQKRAVDRAAERAVNRPPSTPKKSTDALTPAQYFDQLQKHYRKEKSAEKKAATRTAAEKKRTDNEVETSRSRPGTLTPQDVGNIFVNISAKEAKEPGRKDTLWYQRQVKEYISKTDTRKFVETETRTMEYGGGVSTGKFFSFRYFAKTLSMKVFDRSPLIYVLEDQGDYFRGANFHYLTNKALRFQLVQEIIRGEEPNFPDIMIHTYSKEDKCLLSPLYHLQPNEMKIAVFLPLEKFYYR